MTWNFAWLKLYDKVMFAVTPCNDYLWLSWGGSEKNRWFQLDISIILLWYLIVFWRILFLCFLQKTIKLFGRLLSSEKHCPAFFTTTWGERYRKLAGTTTLAYRIVRNCTTVEWVLRLVSTFRLACSTHRQETEEILYSRFHKELGLQLDIRNVWLVLS